MSFEEWDDNDWKVIRWIGNQYALKVPGMKYIFNEHDLLQLAHNINSVVEHIYDKEYYYIHDGDIFRRDGGQLLGVIEDCEELNRLYKENQQLKQEIETLQEQLAHFDIGDGE